jgi:hypothetical protein
MKIVRGRFRTGDRQRLNTFGFYGNYSFLILQLAFNQQKLLLHEGRIIFLEQLWGDDRIGDARFIFQAEKQEPIRGWRIKSNVCATREGLHGKAHVCHHGQLEQITAQEASGKEHDLQILDLPGRGVQPGHHAVVKFLRFLLPVMGAFIDMPDS